MQTNNIVTRVNAGQKAYGFTMSFPSTSMVELMGLAGFDFVAFDAEHGPFTVESLDDLCRVAEGSGLTPVARVPNIEPSTVLRFLDRGVMGITGPHVTTRARAQQFAEACRYVPLGKRSYGSARGASFGVLDSFTEYMEHRNSQLIVMAQLEDAEVLDDLDGILSVDGIDSYTSGPQDIAQSMGLPGQPDHPRVKEFEATVRDAVHAAGKKMTDDVMVAARTNNLLLDAARAFLEREKSR